MSSDPHVPPKDTVEPLPADPSVNDPVLDPTAPAPGGKVPAPGGKGGKVPAPRRKTPKPKDAAGRFTRAGALWTALAIGFVVLILLLVFIMQNTDTAPVHMFGWAWQLPVGVSLTLAAIAGGLLTFLVGTARILQLRRAAKKNLKSSLL